eukprot:TRINITY_DN4639_c0_g1_i4.p1 TRINITY_DN4639_c0_g1~~TRINITY_DN4639_c0_g1_i4.p1  ORF type:complete len:570 (+),score=124.11 TRINITY_DN4639_c0_g1_i4:71-1780(+)
MSTAQEGIIRQGWLVKQGSMFKGWKSRWVSIQGGFLYIYKTPEHMIPAAKHHIVSARTAKVDVAGFSHCFSVTFSNIKISYTFQAASVSDLDAWITAIDRAQDICRTRVTSVDINSGQRGTASLNALDDQGNAIIHRLAYFGRDEDINALINQGADINQQNIRGDTALHLSVLEGREKTVSLLIGRGAKTEITDKRGCTPLHVAALTGREKVINLLLDAGANPFYRHSNGKLPSDMAQKKKARDILQAACASRPPQQIFGSLLETAVKIRQSIEPQAKIPFIVEDAVAYLEKNAMDIEGIFRISGSASEVQSWKEKYNTGYRLDLSKVVDPNSISGVLKLYLRELSEPIIPYDLYEEFIAATDTEDMKDKILQMISHLPQSNQSVLHVVIGLLHVVSKNSAVNKMSSGNLAVVFGPNLLRPKDPSVLKIMNDNPSVLKIVSMLIETGFETERRMSVSARNVALLPATQPDTHAEFGRNTISADPEEEEHVPVTFLSVTALYDYSGEPGSNDLAFSAGQIILVLQQGDDGWWFGSLEGRTGFFPCNFVAYQDAIDHGPILHSTGIYFNLQ